MTLEFESLRGSLHRLKLLSNLLLSELQFKVKVTSETGVQLLKLLLLCSANDEIVKVRKSTVSEVARLQLALKTAECQVECLEKTVEQRVSRQKSTFKYQ